jgi:hypothetical protein
VHHQLGHVEKRKKYKWKDPWTMTEWGNLVADGIAGSARKMAEKEEKGWVAQVDKWNAEVDRRDRLGGITKEVAKPVRARAVLLMPAWKLANSMQWVLCWEDLEVTGPTATWVRETLQNAYSTDYLRKQSAGLLRSHVPQDTVDCDDLLGKSFRLDGEEWEVIEADASSGLVKYAWVREREDDMEEVSSEEMEEATPEEECAPRACESVEATAARRWMRS